MTVAASLVVEISGRDVNLAALLQRVQTQLQQVNTAGTRTAGVLGGTLTTSQERAAREALGHASAEARLAASLGQPERGIVLLNQALGQQSERTLQVINAERQLVGLHAQAGGSVRTLTSSLQALNSTLGAIGASVGIGALIRLGGDALGAANSLEKTEATVRALSGSQTRYGEVLATAVRTQSQFGGSLEENLRGLGSLVNLSNRAGVSLDRLNNIAQRLALVDPLQGIEGAQIALKEFFSGDITSLARRFELPRQELNKLKDASISTADKMAGLDALLNRQGISSDVLAARTRTAAASFDQLGAQASNASVSVGKLTQELLKVPAQIATKLLVDVAGGLGTLANADTKLKAIQDRMLAVSDSFSIYQQHLKSANDQLAPFGVSLGGLTEQQFAFARGLIRSGASAADAMEKVRSFETVIQAGALANTDWGQSSDALVNKMLALAQTSASNRTAVEGLSRAYLAGGISGAELERVIALLIAREEEHRQAAAAEAVEQYHLTGVVQQDTQARLDAATAILGHTAASAASAEQSAITAANQQAQTAQTQLLEAQTRLTTDAFLALNPNIDAAGIAALVTAGKISPLIGQLAAAALQARDATNALIAFNNAANVKSVGATVAQNRAEGRLGRGDSSDSAEMAAAAAPRLRQLESLTKAQEDYDRALGNLGPMRARAQADLQRAKLYGNTEGILKAKTELISLDAEEERLSKKAAGRAKGAGGGAAKLTDQARLNNSLLAQQERADNQAEDAALKHEQRLVDIEDAAYAKRLAASRKYHQDRLDGEAGFYDALGSLGSSGNAKADQELRKSLSARYEAAALKADEIARTRGADAGDAFLEASAAAIQKEGALQDKINKAKQEKNAGEAEYLTGVLALQKKADDARLAQIEADGSAIEAERQKQLSDEDTSYAAAQTRIETASTRATDAKVLNAQRSGKAIDVENLKLQEQEDRLKRIGGAAGGVGGSGATAAPGAGTVPPASAAASPGGGIDLGGAFEALRAAVAGVEAAVRATGGDVTAAQRDTTRAVRGLSNGGGVIS